jgi:cobalt-zinc-cadmium efflux system outer membrane protein
MRSVQGVWQALVLAAGLLPASCAPINHAPELQQAAQDLEQATGVKPAWSEQFEPRELEPGANETVALDQVVELTLVNNRALRADLEAIGQAKAELVQAGLLPNPMLSLMLRFPETGGRAMFDFGLVQDLAGLWLIPSKKQAAQAMLQQRLLSFTDSAVALVAEAKTAYRMLQYLARALEYQQQDREILRQATEVAETRLRAGSAAQLDLNLLQGRYLEAEIELVQLRSEFRTTQQMLLRLMGVARAPDTWQCEPLDLATPPQRLPGVEEDFIEIAIARRLDVQAAYWELESAAAEFAKEKLRLIQGLGIGIAGLRTEQTAQPGRNILADTVRSSVAAGRLMPPEIQSRRERRLMRRQELDFLLGPSLDLSLPIFDQNQAQVAKAHYRARELRRRYEEAEQRVIEGVRAALTQRRLAEDRARLYQESLLPLLESNLQLAQTAYQAGKEPILTVLVAQQDLIRARLGYAAAVRDLASTAANLERQLAGRIPEFSQPPTTQPVETDALPPSIE